MPKLHQTKDEYIYKAIINGENKLNNNESNLSEVKPPLASSRRIHPVGVIKEGVLTSIFDGTPGPIYTWCGTVRAYKYSNTLFENKVYTKVFDPKTFMKRGDVIHFGNDNYRNNNKLIFNGEKLEQLYTDIDDYGSVPPNYECGDEPTNFNIGDFEDIIVHNTINWLSKDKLKEIEIYEKDNKIFGKVTIKGKLWKINIHLHIDTTFDTGYSRMYSRQFKCDIEDDLIKIHVKDSYLIRANYDENINKLKSLVLENNNVNIIEYYSPKTNNKNWFLYNVKNKTKLNNISTLNFPLIIESLGDSECLILDKNAYDLHMKYYSTLDNIYINEIIGYPITIELIEKDTNMVMNYVKDYINSLVENYDDISKRQPIVCDGKNMLSISF